MPEPDPNILVVLTTARTEFEGATYAAVLKDNGVPAEVFATSANVLQWEGGYTDPIKVMVRRADVRRAAEILKRNRQESIDIDWAEVDVGRMEPGAVPAEFRPPSTRYVWRRRIRRTGFLLLGAAFLARGVSASLAITILAGSLILIILSWNDDLPANQPRA